jgi:AcrR family transcriptional regulator
MSHITRRNTNIARAIVSAAGVVFANHGFRGTTIRQITARAGVNVAAVNYYFKTKRNLYTQVLREAKRHVAWIRIGEMTGPPEEKFGTFIEHFVGSLLDPRRPSWHSRILAMEMANPTPALNVVIEELTAPLFRDARTLIREIVGGMVSAAELDLFTLSVVGQCVLYANSRPLVEQVAVDLEKMPHRNKMIAAHVTKFSLMALGSYDRRPKRKLAPIIPSVNLFRRSS